MIRAYYTICILIADIMIKLTSCEIKKQKQIVKINKKQQELKEFELLNTIIKNHMKGWL